MFSPNQQYIYELADLSFHLPVHFWQIYFALVWNRLTFDLYGEFILFYTPHSICQWAHAAMRVKVDKQDMWFGSKRRQTPFHEIQPAPCQVGDV